MDSEEVRPDFDIGISDGRFQGDAWRSTSSDRDNHSGVSETQSSTEDQAQEEGKGRAEAEVGTKEDSEDQAEPKSRIQKQLTKLLETDLLKAETPRASRSGSRRKERRKRRRVSRTRSRSTGRQTQEAVIPGRRS